MRLTYQFQLIQAIRDYFLQNKFTDVMTPPLVENPGMETHIHPFKVHPAYTGSTFAQNSNEAFLHTSPEFCMKELLANSNEQLENIFTLTYCFRDEPNSPVHRNQFIMLEWYRKNSRYEKIMQDCQELISFCSKQLSNKLSKDLIKPHMQNLKLQKATIQELFLETIHLDILQFLDTNDLKVKIQKDFPDVPLPVQDCTWDDYYFLLFLNKIEPLLEQYPGILLYEFPAPLAALSTLKESDPRVCERFEIYLDGIELCNCFNELTNLETQKERFNHQAQEKKSLYGYELPTPKQFYTSLQKGLPPSSGIALGVERLLAALIEIENPFYK